jgi:hypothetical protein
MRLATCEISNRPAVAWIKEPDSGPGELYVAVANSTKPDTLGEWRIDMVYSGELEYGQPSIGICEIEGEAGYLFYADGKLRYGRYHGPAFSSHALPEGGVYGALANIAGVPAVIFTGDGSWHYLYAQNADPQSEGDWTSVTIDSPYGAKPDTNIPNPFMDIGGRPMFSGTWGQDDYAVVFATANPPTASSWGMYIWHNDHTNMGFRGRLFNNAGLPAVMLERYTSPDTYYDQYASATILAPGQDADWVYLPKSPGVAGSAAGIPVFRTNFSASGELYMANSQHPAATADWKLVNAPQDFWGQHIVNFSGYPAFLYHGQGHDQSLLLRYPIP